MASASSRISNSFGGCAGVASAQPILPHINTLRMPCHLAIDVTFLIAGEQALLRIDTHLIAGLQACRHHQSMSKVNQSCYWLTKHNDVIVICFAMCSNSNSPRAD